MYRRRYADQLVVDEGGVQDRLRRLVGVEPPHHLREHAVEQSRPAIAAVLHGLVLGAHEVIQRTDPDLAYVGFTIPPTFVVGYGLDVAERYRNLDHIAEYLVP